MDGKADKKVFTGWLSGGDRCPRLPTARGWAGGWCAVSHHTAPEELKHIVFLGVYSSLASPSEWDVMEGTCVGYRCLQRDPLCFGKKQRYLRGIEPRSCCGCPDAPLSFQSHTSLLRHLLATRVPPPYFQPFCCCCQLVLAGSLAQAPLLCKPVGLTVSTEPSSQGT